MNKSMIAGKEGRNGNEGGAEEVVFYAMLISGVGPNEKSMSPKQWYVFGPVAVRLDGVPRPARVFHIRRPNPRVV